MSPPSSGGLAVAQTLGILENFNLDLFPPTALDIEGGKPQVQAVHLVSEAERLAYADRNKYVADTDFVPLPGGSYEAMIEQALPAQPRRPDQLHDARMGTAQPGNLGPGARSASARRRPEPARRTSPSSTRPATPSSMTTTVESGFGSFHMTQGFILNNQLTDFYADADRRTGATDRQPRRAAEAAAQLDGADAGLQDERRRQPRRLPHGHRLAGRRTIIQYVVKTLVGALDWGLDAQQATSMVDFGAANSPTTNVGGEHPNVNAANNGANDPLVTGLRALGHTVSVSAQSSGISTVIRVQANGAPALHGRRRSAPRRARARRRAHALGAGDWGAALRRAGRARRAANAASRRGQRAPPRSAAMEAGDEVGSPFASPARTKPSSAVATRPAMRATALLTPDAEPTWRRRPRPSPPRSAARRSGHADGEHRQAGKMRVQ